jgi:hypothetical protein
VISGNLGALLLLPLLERDILILDKHGKRQRQGFQLIPGTPYLIPDINERTFYYASN